MERADAHFVECGAGNGFDIVRIRSVPETTTAGDYTQYVAGIYGAAPTHTNDIACMVTTENTIVTSWGDSGYFGYYSVEGSDGPYYTRVMHQLSDGRILIATDSFSIGGTPAYMADLIMVNADGTLDTTWGNNGFFGGLQGTWQYSNINAILEDASGNFHIFCQVPAFSGGYYKISSTGTFISGLYGTNYSVLYAFNGACWADDEKTRIIAVGATNQILNPGVGYVTCNVSAIDPTTGTRDNTWTGNVGITGAAKYGAEAPTLLPLYSINRMSDDGFVTFENAGSPAYVHKFIADGSAYDADWGTAGKLQVGLYNINMRSNCVIQDGDTIYMYTINDAGKVRINNIDGSVGTVTDYYDTTIAAGGYVSLSKIDEQIFAGRAGTPTLDIERYDTDLDYLDGIDIGVQSVYWLLPDEETRESITVSTYWATYTEDGTEVDFSHLIGETVSILADGVVYPDQVVDDNGHIDASAFSTATKVHVGLAYESKLKPMKPVSQPDMMSKTVTCKQMGISVHNTDDIEYGVSDDDMKEINFDDVQWKNKCEIDGLFTGTVAVSVPDGFSVNLPLQIVTSAPLPAVIRALIPKVD